MRKVVHQSPVQTQPRPHRTVPTRVAHQARAIPAQDHVSGRHLSVLLSALSSVQLSMVQPCSSSHADTRSARHNTKEPVVIYREVLFADQARTATSWLAHATAMAPDRHRTVVARGTAITAMAPAEADERTSARLSWLRTAWDGTDLPRVRVIVQRRFEARSSTGKRSMT